MRATPVPVFSDGPTHPVTTHRREKVGVDDRNRPKYEDRDYSELVYAWYPPAADPTRYSETRDAVLHDLDVLAATDLGLRHNDGMTIEGKRYRVEGDPEDYNHGPFGFAPGYRINLFAVEERP